MNAFIHRSFVSRFYANLDFIVKEIRTFVLIYFEFNVLASLWRRRNKIAKTLNAFKNKTSTSVRDVTSRSSSAMFRMVTLWIFWSPGYNSRSATMEASFE